MKIKTYSAADPTPRVGRPLRRRPGLLCWGILFAVLCLVPGPLSAGQAETESSILAPLAPKSLLLDAVVIDGGIWAVGERGHVLFSPDNALTWRQVPVPTRATLTGLAFHGNRFGWAVGHREVILRTTDGGQSWQKVHQDDEGDALLDVWFKDAENGFAIGAYGRCLRTRDGGTSWQAQRVSENDWHLHHLARSPSGRLYIAAEAGQIYRSDDDGETWQTLPSPYNGSFFGVLPLQDDALMVLGLRGHVFASADAGQSWSPVSTGTLATLAHGLVLSDGRILLAGLAGTLLVGRGQDPDFEPIPGPGRRGVWAVVQISPDGIVCFGEGGATRLNLGP